MASSMPKVSVINGRTCNLYRPYEEGMLGLFRVYYIETDSGIGYYLDAAGTQRLESVYSNDTVSLGYYCNAFNYDSDNNRWNQVEIY